MQFFTSVASALVPALLVLAGAAAFVAVIYLWRRNENKRRRHSPVTHKMLRSPGLSLRSKLDDVDLKVDTYLVMFVVIPVAVYAIHLSQSYFANQSETGFRIAMSLAIGLAGGLIFGRLLFTALGERKRLLLGLEGELATGQELDQLMIHGYRVFHDIPTRWGNIDHVVIGPGGVFTVETKMRQKPSDENRNWEVTVDYGQELLKFPDWVETKPFEQARTQQKWLSEYLRSNLSDTTKVVATIALPGWSVARTGGRWSVPVFNPRNPQKFFAQISDGSLPDKAVARISERLDDLCRDVEPSFKKEGAEQ